MFIKDGLLQLIKVSSINLLRIMISPTPVYPSSPEHFTAETLPLSVNDFCWCDIAFYLKIQAIPSSSTPMTNPSVASSMEVASKKSVRCQLSAFNQIESTLSDVEELFAVNKPVRISFAGTSTKFQLKKLAQRESLTDVLSETMDSDEIIISAKPKFT